MMHAMRCRPYSAWSSDWLAVLNPEDPHSVAGVGNFKDRYLDDMRDY